MSMERGFFAASTLLLGAYAFVVLAGKAGSLLKFEPPFSLGDIGEFLVVLAAMVLFVTGLMLREAREQARSGSPSQH